MFRTPWYGPCRQLAPDLDRIAREQEGRPTVAKLNTGETPAAMIACSVLAGPTLRVCCDGELVKEIAGAGAKRRLMQELDDILPHDVATGATASPVSGHRHR